MTLPTFCILLSMIELSIGAPLVVSPVVTARRLNDLSRHDLLYPVVGLLTALFCAVPPVGHPWPSWSLAGVIIGAAWLGLRKGLSIVWFPRYLQPVAEFMLSGARRVCIVGICAILAGILFLVASSPV